MMLKKFAAALLATSMIAAVATVAYGMGSGLVAAVAVAQVPRVARARAAQERRRAGRRR